MIVLSLYFRYGARWRESYAPPAREFGPVTAGEWDGWQCIGPSSVIGPD